MNDILKDLRWVPGPHSAALGITVDTLRANMLRVIRSSDRSDWARDRDCADLEALCSLARRTSAGAPGTHRFEMTPEAEKFWKEGMAMLSPGMRAHFELHEKMLPLVAELLAVADEVARYAADLRLQNMKLLKASPVGPSPLLERFKAARAAVITCSEAL